MNPERWQKVTDVFTAALECETGGRAALLAEACAGDDALRGEVESLLTAHERSADFLAQPILACEMKTEPPVAPSSLSGRRIGRYQVLSLLGRGGMGEVYLAEDTRLGRKLALKLLPPEFTRDRVRLERFEQEARAASALNHPNILTIFEIDERDGLHFIATEFIDGETLRQRLTRGDIDWRAAVEIARQIAGALAAAHEAGIVHRDIKPENLMLRRDGLVKVLDFGLAKTVGGEAPGNAACPPTLAPTETDPTILLGTLNYLSPEQVRREPLDQRTDIFSLGVVLYEMLAGTRPFTGRNPAELLDAILNAEPPPLTREPLPAKPAQIVKRALAKDRADRYQTAAELHADLERLARKSAPVTADLKPPPQRRAMGTVLWCVAALAVALALAAAYRLLPVQYTTKNGGAATNGAQFVQLTNLAGQELFPSLSPDGRTLVFAARGGDDWDIFRQGTAGGAPRNLTADCAANDTQPTFSPDGQWIAFRSDCAGGGVFVMNAEGGAVKRLTAFGHHPAWSPDGQELLFTRENVQDPYNRNAGRPETRTVRIATGKQRLVTDDDAAQPQWSPNGRRIAYWGARQNAQRDIWTMPADRYEPVEVTNDAALDWDPVWSPDGRHLYFLSDRAGGMKLFRVPIDERSGKVTSAIEAVPTPYSELRHLAGARNGEMVFTQVSSRRRQVQRIGFDPASGLTVGAPVPLTPSHLLIDEPDVSPDGQWLVARVLDGGREDLVLFSSAGTDAPRRLTNDEAKDRGPRWSPDGRRIAFYSNRTQSWEIWTINPAGGELQRLTFTDRTNAFNPIWSPRGDRLLYTNRRGSPYVIEVGKPFHEQTPQPLPGFGAQMTFWPSAWSPDGEKLAGGWRKEANAAYGVAVYSFAARRFTPLFPHINVRTIWLQDSRRLLSLDFDRLALLDGGARRIVLNLLPHEILQFTLARDNRLLYFSLEETEADIGLRTLPPR